MNNPSKWMPGLIALTVACAMPMAFAQTAPTTDAGATPPTEQAAPPTAAQPTVEAQPKQVTWADLDADKDGNLSKAEVATVPALNQVFDQADADGNGKLTAEEYKAFAAKGGDAAGGASGG